MNRVAQQWQTITAASIDNGRIEQLSDNDLSLAGNTPTALKSPAADMAVVEVRGEDARDFLHAQFTADLLAMQSGQACLTGWCTPKGRVLFPLRVICDDARWWLILNRADAEAFCKRLGMFVLRAAVEIINHSDTLAVIETWHSQTPTQGIVAAGHIKPRQWLLVNNNELDAVWSGIPAAAVGQATADLLNIRHGEAFPCPQHKEVFLPQELNFDHLNGLSFEKGCYPGQEIIARVKFRGRVKARMQRFSGAHQQIPAPGAVVIDAENNKVGECVRAAQSAEHQFEMLAVIKTSAVAPLHLDSPAVQLEQLELPYVLDDS